MDAQRSPPERRDIADRWRLWAALWHAMTTGGCDARLEVRGSSLWLGRGRKGAAERGAGRHGSRVWEVGGRRATDGRRWAVLGGRGRDSDGSLAREGVAEERRAEEGVGCLAATWAKAKQTGAAGRGAQVEFMNERRGLAVAPSSLSLSPSPPPPSLLGSSSPFLFPL